MSKWPLWVMMLTSSFSLMFLNIERYISIVYPIFHHTKITRKNVLMFFANSLVFGFTRRMFGCFKFCFSRWSLWCRPNFIPLERKSCYIDTLHNTSFFRACLSGNDTLWTHDCTPKKKCEI